MKIVYGIIDRCEFCQHHFFDYINGKTTLRCKINRIGEKENQEDAFLTHCPFTQESIRRAYKNVYKDHIISKKV